MEMSQRTNAPLFQDPKCVTRAAGEISREFTLPLLLLPFTLLLADGWDEIQRQIVILEEQDK